MPCGSGCDQLIGARALLRGTVRRFVLGSEPDKLVPRCACTDRHEGTQLMHAFVRSVARRTSIGLGALALAVGVAACGGDDGQESAPRAGSRVEESALRRMSRLDPGDGDEPQSDAGGETDGGSRPPTATGMPRAVRAGSGGRAAALGRLLSARSTSRTPSMRVPTCSIRDRADRGRGRNAEGGLRGGRHAPGRRR